MKVALINCSPKFRGSATEIILRDIKALLGFNSLSINLHINTDFITDEMINELYSCDEWVFGYPLYVDGLPSHMLSCLCEIERKRENNKSVTVYGIANCGFYEGNQCDVSLQILENFCLRMGFVFGTGLGIGGGAALPATEGKAFEKMLKNPLEKSFTELCDLIDSGRRRGNQYIEIGTSKKIYISVAQKSWDSMAKKNGLSKKDL